MARAIVDGLGQGLHGDKTTTGATCIGNFPWATQDDRDVLRIGDTTTPCPKCGEAGTIVEGSPAIHWHGRATALHGALIRCACPTGDNRLIAWPEPELVREMPPIPLPFADAPSPAAPSTASRPNNSLSGSGPGSADEDNEAAEPGFYIVPKSTTRQQLIAELFGEVPSPEVMRKFNGLNGSLGEDIVKAGQMVVLGDPRNYMCMREEAHLMEAADEVAVALADLEPADADFMVKYRGEIAALLGEVSLWAGVSAAVLEKHMRDLTDTLIRLEKLHQDTHRTYGHLRVPDFFEKRKKLLEELDSKFFKSTRVRGFTLLGDHPKLRKSLSISTKSLVHHWKKAGGPGDIPGFSRYVKSMSKAAEYMKTGGFIAIGIGGVSSALAIWETCTTDNDAACKQVAMKEVPKFLISSGTGFLAGNMAAKHSLKICGGRSRSPTGFTACVATVVGGASFAGVAMGELAGEYLGESVHDHFLRD